MCIIFEINEEILKISSIHRHMDVIFLWNCIVNKCASWLKFFYGLLNLQDHVRFRWPSDV